MPLYRVSRARETTVGSLRRGCFETLVITETSVNGEGGGARHVEISKSPALA
jgi:hypothetical protein